MIVTVEEAKQKYCCQNISNGGLCIGSACMGWVWYSTIEETIYEERTSRSIMPQLLKVKRHIYKPKDEWTGYCGVAGK